MSSGSKVELIADRVPSLVKGLSSIVTLKPRVPFPMDYIMPRVLLGDTVPSLNCFIEPLFWGY